MLYSSNRQLWRTDRPGEQCPAKIKLKSVLRSMNVSDLARWRLFFLLPMAKISLLKCPTGGGKSLCMYLVPLSISNEAMGIVISLLVGLMVQQVNK